MVDAFLEKSPVDPNLLANKTLVHPRFYSAFVSSKLLTAYDCCLICTERIQHKLKNRFAFVFPFTCRQFHLVCQACVFADKKFCLRWCDGKPWHYGVKPYCADCKKEKKDFVELLPNAQKCFCHIKHWICQECNEKNPSLSKIIPCPCTSFQNTRQIKLEEDESLKEMSFTKK